MVELIAKIVLVVSFLGLVSILLKKIPQLTKPESEEELSAGFISKIRDKFNERFGHFSLHDFLEKTLLKFRIFTQKTENKTTSLIKKMQEDKAANGGSEEESDNYWKKLKK